MKLKISVAVPCFLSGRAKDFSANVYLSNRYFYCKPDTQIISPNCDKRFHRIHDKR